MHLCHAPICTYGCTHGAHRIISVILRNEKYKGDALLQKTFTVEQAAFDRKAKELNERFRKADAKLNRLKAEKQDRLMRVCSVKKYVENLRGQAGPIEVWNEQAWCLLVMQVTVHADGSAEFLFRGENRITVK